MQMIFCLGGSQLVNWVSEQKHKWDFQESEDGEKKKKNQKIMALKEVIFFAQFFFFGGVNWLANN